MYVPYLLLISHNEYHCVDIVKQCKRKAQYEERKIEKSTVTKKYTEMSYDYSKGVWVCEWCGREYTSGGDAYYCSAKCRHEAEEAAEKR